MSAERFPRKSVNTWFCGDCLDVRFQRFRFARGEPLGIFSPLPNCRSGFTPRFPLTLDRGVKPLLQMKNPRSKPSDFVGCRSGSDVLQKKGGPAGLVALRKLLVLQKTTGSMAIFEAIRW